MTNMRVISLERSGFVQTIVILLATMTSLTLLSLVMAHWTWVWVVPSSESPAYQTVQTGVSTEAAFHLFGATEKSADDSVLIGHALVGNVSAGGGIRLLGIVAATTGHSGYAVVQLASKDIVALREGEDIAPGLRLTEVSADHLILERSGIRETLTWSEKSIVIQ